MYIIISEMNEYCITERNMHVVSAKFLILMKIVLKFVF